MNSFTQDPWELMDRGDYDDYDGNSRVIVAGDRRIAVVLVSDEETDKNAHLIVSAPQLLEALKNCINGLGCQPGYVNTRSLANAQAVIALAEGRL